MCQIDATVKIKRKVLLQTLTEFVKHYDRNTCTHEEVEKRGTLWTVCLGCESVWSADRNPYKPYVEPQFVTDARDLLKA